MNVKVEIVRMAKYAALHSLNFVTNIHIPKH